MGYFTDHVYLFIFFKFGWLCLTRWRTKSVSRFWGKMMFVSYFFHSHLINVSHCLPVVALVQVRLIMNIVFIDSWKLCPGVRFIPTAEGAAWISLLSTMFRNSSLPSLHPFCELVGQAILWSKCLVVVFYCAIKNCRPPFLFLLCERLSHGIHE